MLPNVKSSSNALPTSLHDACLGGVHTPVNCHRQRLLVASQKPTKVKEAAKAKAKPEAKSSAKAKPGPKPKKTQATPAAAAAGKESKTSTTAYALEKNKFLATLLGSVKRMPAEILKFLCYITCPWNVYFSQGWIHLCLRRPGMRCALDNFFSHAHAACVGSICPCLEPSGGSTPMNDSCSSAPFPSLRRNVVGTSRFLNVSPPANISSAPVICSQSFDLVPHTKPGERLARCPDSAAKCQPRAVQSRRQLLRLTALDRRMLSQLSASSALKLQQMFWLRNTFGWQLHSYCFCIHSFVSK